MGFLSETNTKLVLEDVANVAYFINENRLIHISLFALHGHRGTELGNFHADRMFRTTAEANDEGSDPIKYV